jgi:multidrug resistance efflux pump
MKPAPALLRVLVTAAMVGLALPAVDFLWTHYRLEPWTRDGRVRAEVADIAPDVPGLVTEVDVRDNTPVRRGQVLFLIDRAHYQVALEQAQAALQSQAAALAQARREDARNHRLDAVVSKETIEQGAAKVAELEAAVDQATAQRDAARLNLSRTTVVSPIDGVAANVWLRPGDYLPAGKAAVAVLDSASLHVDGYFEETKLARIRLGDEVSVKMMGDDKILTGHVESFAPGITDRERALAGNLLDNVNPTFNWVRLAQRVPVRVRLDHPPADALLIAGRTATVVVHSSAPRPPALLGRILSALRWS